MAYIQAGQKSPDWNSTVRNARLIHFAMLGAAVLQLYVLYTLIVGRATPQRPVDPVMSYVFTFVGLMDFGIAQVIRMYFGRRTAPLIQKAPLDANLQMQWRAVCIVSSALAYSIYLFGWVLALLGGFRWSYIFLWSVSAAAFYLFVPRPPVDEAARANLPPGMQ